LLLVGSAVSCVHHAQRDACPVAFYQLAVKFKAKAGHDRRDEGEKIQPLLPRCPVTSYKDIGTGAIVTYDYLHPSYKLSTQELFRTLGHPDSSYGDTVWYDLVHDTNNMIWQLSVEFRDDYVVGSMISGSLKSDK
jgi:hypothetical protein